MTEDKKMTMFLEFMAMTGMVVFDLSADELYASFTSPSPDEYPLSHDFVLIVKGWLFAITNAKEAMGDPYTIRFSWTGGEPYQQLLASVIDRFIEY